LSAARIAGQGLLAVYFWWAACSGGCSRREATVIFRVGSAAFHGAYGANGAAHQAGGVVEKPPPSEYNHRSCAEFHVLESGHAPQSNVTDTHLICCVQQICQNPSSDLQLQASLSRMGVISERSCEQPLDETRSIR